MGQDGLGSIRIKIIFFFTFYLFSYKIDVSGTTNQKLSKFALQQPTWIAKLEITAFLLPVTVYAVAVHVLQMLNFRDNGH